MKTNIHTLMAGSLMLTVALAAGCERESKGPRVYNHPPATVGPPADLSQFDAPAPPAPASAASSLELSPEVADVVDMAKRGVGNEALLAFVEQNPVTHRIAAETIIFLNDLGVPENVVALMIRQGDAVEDFVPTEPAPVTVQPVASTPPPTPPPVNDPPVVNNHYYGALSPYGDWIYDGSHGWVWRPTVAVVDVGWRPYRQGGRWIYSDAGWYWHSYYSWGWAPFHYGRWHRSSHHGWCWVPGYTWSPAWVMWRSNDHYAGWAPLPAGSHYVHGIGYTWGGSHVGFSFGFGLGHGWFTYCDYAHLRHRRLHHHRVPDNNVAIIHNETTVVNNYVTENNTTIINAGIPPEVIAEKTREPVQKMRIRELDLEIESIARVGQIDANGKTMAVYRPQVPTPPDTPGEKPSDRTPVTKNPTPGESEADKPETDQKMLKQYGNGSSVANRSKITGRLTPGILARPLGRTTNRPRSGGAIAASPSRAGTTKPGRTASASAKPSARKTYSRSAPGVNITRKPGPSATSRQLAPSTRRSTTPSRAWQQRPSRSYSAPRSTQRSVAPKPTARPSRVPSSRSIAPRYSPPSRSYSAPKQHARLLHGPPGHRHVQLPADPTPLLPEVTRHRPDQHRPGAILLRHRVLPGPPRVEVPPRDHQVRRAVAARIRAEKGLSRKQE